MKVIVVSVIAAALSFVGAVITHTAGVVSTTVTVLMIPVETLAAESVNT